MMLPSLFCAMLAPIALASIGNPHELLPRQAHRRQQRLPRDGSPLGISVSVGLSIKQSAPAATIMTKPTDGYGSKPKGPKYSSIVMFGASYCDNAHPRDLSKYGNSVKPPPYYKGRWSNGIVWVEYLANGLLGYNTSLLDYAYGGAQISNQLTGGSVPDTGAQVSQYLAAVDAKKVDRGKGAVLHAFWIGINTVNQIWDDAIGKGALSGNTTAQTRAKTRITANINELMRQVKLLTGNANVNKQPSNILVLPIPPLEIVPNLYFQAQDLANGDSKKGAQYLQYIGNLTTQFNQELTNAVASMGKQKGATGWIRTFDVVGYWRDVKAHPKKYNFTNVTDPCLNPSTNVPCKQQDKYEYWDTLHMTTAAHQHFAKAVVPTCLSV